MEEQNLSKAKLEIPMDSKTMDATVAIHKSVWVEFIAQPMLSTPHSVSASLPDRK
jgi:hypothetical protein